jgi:hypothetical protein
MKFFRLICRIIIGILFIFSGIVKAIDPLGSAYKFQDYFQAFHIEFFAFLSLPLAILLCTAEFIAGFSVLTGIRQKSGILGVFILMLIFTPLTFVLALSNPVSDCGCFGDAIHLTNWQTFGKNIILLLLIIPLLINKKETYPDSKILTEWSIIIFAAFIFVLFSFFNLRYLPVIDFLPYKTGVNIPGNMIIPDGVPSDEYSTTFIYKKNGVEKEFTLDNYPADDTSWIFVEQKSKLIKKGYKPPIHDFIITDLNNMDITEKVLSDTGYSVLMIAKKIQDADHDQLIKGFEIGHELRNSSVNFYILTASGSVEAKKFDNGLQFCLMDETTLKTMMRANPGYILIRNGTIIKKWSWANIPPAEKILGTIVENKSCNVQIEK